MYRSIVEAVFDHAKTTPDKLCLADDTSRVTYREYAEKIGKAAAVFADLGVKDGDTVVLEANQTVDYLALELALHLLRAVFVPAEKSTAPEKIAALAVSAEADVIVTNKPVEAEGKTSLTVSEFYEKANAVTETPDFSFPDADTVSEILFSTGTTGKEKGIVLTHGNDIALAENVVYGVEMKPDNVEMIPSPMNHSHGLRRYYANMWLGATVVLLGSVLDMNRFFKNLDELGVNSMDLVPSALSVILRLSKGKLAEYRDRLRYIQLGSAPINKADKETVRELLPDTMLYNFYGSTESGCIIIYEFNHTANKENCIGHPAHNCELIIVDDDRNPIKSDAEHTGLLSSKGPMNMKGYFKDEEETAKALKGGVVYSNDIAYIDEDGDVILLGRKGDVINIGGKKVSPDEIENTAKKMEGIDDCACIPVPDEMKGSVPKLFVKMKRGTAFDQVKITEFLAASLEPFKVPKYIEEIAQIPRTFNGKILRRELMKK